MNKFQVQTFNNGKAIIYIRAGEEAHFTVTPTEKGTLISGPQFIGVTATELAEIEAALQKAKELAGFSK